MKILLAAAILLVTTGAGFAMDAESQAVTEHYKPGKLMRIADVGTLMTGSERWCYAEDAGSCDWTDIYLEVTDKGAQYEIANSWDENLDIAFTDRGEFVDDRYICETGYDWIPTARAVHRADGTAIGGRDLAAIRDQVRDANSDDVRDCFDYLYLSSDAAADTVTLLQRQYDPQGNTDPANDVEVTIHFNAEDAAALTLQY